jgi:short-subunit dehydrogenase/SAM-dependent methyltransferase
MGLIFQQSRRYARHGLGFFGALLKHSLVPLEILCDVLPERGTVLDLGSGEGMLANLIAHRKPGLKILGIDLDQKKISAANENTPGNASFVMGDIFTASFPQAQGAVLNDVLHHHAYDRQKDLLLRLAGWLDDGAVVIVKEVDAEDRADKAWTTFWDKRLYPKDTLQFRNRSMWEQVLTETGFRVLAVRRVSHPWPASRTVFICRYEKTAATSPKEKPTAQKVLVTGATGFLGTHLIQHLHEHGLGGKPVELIALVRNAARTPRGISDRCLLLESDLENLSAHAAKLKTFDYVFHLAADKNFFGGRPVYENNLKGTKALLDALLGSLQLKRIVFASSMGAVDRAASDLCESPITETLTPSPSSWYGRAKLAEEKLLADYRLPFTIARLPWCYGPGMSAATHVRALAQMVEKRKWITRWDWPGRISVLSAGETAKVLEQLAAVPEAAQQIYNVSDGRPVSFGALFHEMGDLTGVPAGQRTPPAFLLGLLRLLRPLLPFSLKCLVWDVLWVDDQKLRGRGIKPQARSVFYLLPLIRWMNLERRPGLAFSTWVVTGAASGIGRALAARLAATGRNLARVDRTTPNPAETGSLPGEETVADLTQATDLPKARALLDRSDVCGLVNCAGVAFLEKVRDQSDEQIRSTLQVNVDALTLLSQSAAKSFVEQGSGTIVNVASSAAFQPLAYMAPYSASKAYVLNFSEALAAELEESGISVITVCPSGTQTSFQQRAGVKASPKEKLLAPASIAQIIVKAIEQGRSQTLLIGRGSWIMSSLARLMPREANARFWRRLMLKERCPDDFQTKT